MALDAVRELDMVPDPYPEAQDLVWAGSRAASKVPSRHHFVPLGHE